jgi:hypothetical protein
MHRNPVTRGLVTRPEDWPWFDLSLLSGGWPTSGLNLVVRSSRVRWRQPAIPK